ncbi:MAG: glycosyltransferase family 2 protein [Bacteroidota bacterium]|nr:glycosyltransferase family 2 protein [Bacteroidota bacterium]
MKTKTRISLSIIIVNWNTMELLRNCLASIYNHTKLTDFEVIVVDNNSSDHSVIMVSSEFQKVKLISNQSNVGFAKANNQAIAEGIGEYILLLNPDTSLRDNVIDRLYGFYKNFDKYKLGIVTCKLLNGDGSFQPSVNKFYSFWNSFTNNRLFSLKSTDNWIYSNDDKYKKIDWAHGAVMFFSRNLVQEIGLLDEQFYIYAEEIDFYLRSKKAGYLNLYLDNLSIIHLGGASSRQNRANMFIQNYRSFFQLLKKHYGYLDYYAYRARTILYLSIWYLYFLFKNSRDSKTFAKVYSKTLLWNIGIRY